MKYPFTVGGGIIPECRFPQYKPEPHEYLIAVGDECAEISDTLFGTTIAAMHILGFIDLTTGEHEAMLTHLMWELSADELRENAFSEFFKERTAYHVKCLPPMKPWFSTPFKRTGNLYLTEIIEADIHEPYIDGVIQKYIDSLHLHSELIGVLDSVDEYPAYRGTFNRLGTEIKIIVSNEFSPVEDALKHMENLCRNCETYDKLFRKFAAEQLTDRANEIMQSSFTKEEFAAGLKIRYIDMFRDGSYTVEFLFNDHLINVDGNLNGLKKADINKYYPEYDD